MGFMVSKGQLEIDIIVVKGLKKSGLVQPPGMYFSLNVKVHSSLSTHF